MPDRWSKLNAVLAAIAGVVLAIVTLVAAIHTDNGHKPAPPAATQELHGPGPNATIPKPPAATVRAAAQDLADKGGRDETPAGADPKTLEAAREQQERFAEHDQLPITTPFTAPVQRGCVTRLVRNYSSRRGVAPREETAHYTVSRNRAGWSDVWAIVSLFDQARYQASSNFVIDGEGHCAYIVRTSDKAWAQAAGNPVAISIEFIAYGDEGRLTPRQLAKGALVFADQGRLWHIPAKLGQVAGCRVIRRGIIDHAMWGPCGGGHHDLIPLYNSPSWATYVAQGSRSTRAQDARRLAPLIRAVAKLRRHVSRLDRLRCTRLNRWRAAGRPHAGAHAAVLRKHTLIRHKVICTPGRPARLAPA